jgi:hypothetical protein
MRITSGGNVGIGTTGPVSKLHVDGNVSIGTFSDPPTGNHSQLEVRGPAGAGGFAVIKSFNAMKLGQNSGVEYGGQAQFWLGRYEESGSNARTALTISLGHGTIDPSSNADVDVMTLLSSGNVGIGTTAPLQTSANRVVTTINGPTSAILNLGVNNSLVTYLYVDASSSTFETAGSNIISASGANPIIFNTNAAERMRITSGGGYEYSATDGIINFTAIDSSGGTPSDYGSFIFNLKRGVDGDQYTNVLVLKAGNVGIGTTAPGSSLTVGTSFATIPGITVDTGNTGNSAFVARKTSSKPAFGILPWEGEVFLSAGVYYDGSTWIHHSNSNDNLLFVLDPGGGARWYASNDGTPSWNVVADEQLWDSSAIWTNLVRSTRSGNSYFTGGNVGIGTTNPSGQLSGTKGLSIVDATNAALGLSNGTNHWLNYLSGTTYRIWNNTSNEVVTILLNGNVGINTTNPSYKLDVVGDARITSGSLGVGVAPNATDGRIDASNDIVAFQTSDRRLKENITPITNALEKVKSLTGVMFDWKEETKSVHGYEGHDVGIIAQDVQAVLPEAVRTNDTGYLSVRYEKMIALLIEANKELATRVEELESKLK